jgi:hypothetical protein
MRRENMGTRPRSRVTPIHALLGAAVLGLLVMPLAFAGAKTPQASSASAKSQLQSLKRRVAALEGKTAALESKPAPTIPPTPTIPTTLPPSGPAGGVLQGTYPNPSALAPNSVGANQIADGSVVSGDLANQSVGGFDLKNTYERVSGGTQVAANTFADATASCDAGDRVIGGGYAWSDDAATDHLVNANTGVVTSSDVTFSTPNRSDNTFGDNPDQWIVRARSNVDNHLFAWAVCLRA